MSMGPGAGNQLNLYPNSTQPVYATTTAGAAPVALGPALSGNGAYPRGAFLIGGTIYGIMSYNPTVLPQSDTSHQALVTIDPAAGTFVVKSIFPQQRYRQPGITPATW